jgi:hypothetical protein
MEKISTVPMTGRGKETGKGYFKGFRWISHASHGLDARANDVDFFSPLFLSKRSGKKMSTRKSKESCRKEKCTCAL